MASGGGGLLPPGQLRSDLEAADSGWANVPISGASPRQGAFGVQAGGGPERPDRRKRLLFFGGLAAAFVVVLVVVIVVGESSAHSSGSSLVPAGGGAYRVRFLAVGDWGREGKHNQSEVAALMGAVAAAHPADFVVSTGDNFYDHGLASADDPLFARTFTAVYSASSLQVPWHAVLGNHDYCDSAVDCDKRDCGVSPLHQLNISLARNRDPRWHCERSYTHTLAGGRVELFFLDTSPFIQRYYTPDNTWQHCPGGLAQQSWRAQLLELEHRLNASAAEWKLAVGHHPTYSNGEHQNNTDIIANLEPLFWRYGVQAYFVGHDHNLEHLQVPGARPDGAPASYAVVVTGAGSKTQRQQNGAAFSRWFYPYSGFVGATVTPEALQLDYYTLEGGQAPAYSASIARQPTAPSAER